MKNATTPMTDIFDGDLELQTFQVPGLTPGLKLKLPFLWKFFASLGRASPLPTAKTIWEISPQIKKQTSTSDRKNRGSQTKNQQQIIAFINGPEATTTLNLPTKISFSKDLFMGNFGHHHFDTNACWI
ncbi:MAG: hypothetical protein LBB26_02525 [Puniceicoccales bacterium]|jgi:hypothetical protein|nr:hypothetical protein [Puniceicoccales bacterium]